MIFANSFSNIYELIIILLCDLYESREAYKSFHINNIIRISMKKTQDYTKIQLKITRKLINIISVNNYLNNNFYNSYQIFSTIDDDNEEYINICVDTKNNYRLILLLLLYIFQEKNKNIIKYSYDYTYESINHIKKLKVENNKKINYNNYFDDYLLNSLNI